MARRTRTAESTDSTATLEAPEATATPSEEDTSMTVTTDTEAPATEETLPEAPEEATSTEAPKATNEVDLSAFTAAVESAIEQRDETTGDLPEAAIASAQTEYRTLDGVKAKNAAKKLVEEKMREAMNRRDISSARAYMMVSDNLTAGASGSKAEKAPADPKEAFVQRYTALALALALVADERPEGVEDSALDVTSLVPAAQALRDFEANEAEDKGDAPEATPAVKAAVKLAVGKSARVAGTRTASTFTGERRDIAAHIQSAFSEVEPGTFLTIAEIRKHRSDEYGDNPPSAGAISARLFPNSGKCTVEGVQPGQNDKGNKGATKVA